MSSESVNSLSDIADIINPDKASIGYAKEAFRDMLGKVNSNGDFVSSSAGNEVFNSMNYSLNVNLGLSGLNGKVIFKSLVSNTSSSFYKFIK